jgi:hypothetical protein
METRLKIRIAEIILPMPVSQSSPASQCVLQMNEDRQYDMC